MSSVEELEAQFKTAQAATEAYSAEIVAKYRQEIPDSPEWREPGPDPAAATARAMAWTEAESAELARLRSIAREAAVMLHRARQQAQGHTSGE